MCICVFSISYFTAILGGSLGGALNSGFENTADGSRAQDHEVGSPNELYGGSGAVQRVAAQVRDIETTGDKVGRAKQPGRFF